MVHRKRRAARDECRSCGARLSTAVDLDAQFCDECRADMDEQPLCRRCKCAKMFVGTGWACPYCDKDHE